MYRLVLDTALEYSYLALLDDNLIMYESYERGSNNHSETLLPKLEECLKNNNLSLQSISEVYTGVGPGSYTGERIAVVIAKMIAAMNGVKLYKFSSLAGIASAYEGEVNVLVDCRRGNAFTARFMVDNNINRLSQDMVVEISEYFKDIDPKTIYKEGKINPVKLMRSKEALIVSDPNSLSPNYIQLVEAERKKMGLE